MLVSSEAESKSELGIVLEKRIRPCGPASLGIFCPWSNRKVAAVNRRTASCIGDLGAVAEQLAQQFEVRRLAAAPASARKLEQRL